MPVRDMVRFVELAGAGRRSVAERLELLVEHRERVLAQIDGAHG